MERFAGCLAWGLINGACYLFAQQTFAFIPCISSSVRLHLNSILLSSWEVFWFSSWSLAQYVYYLAFEVSGCSLELNPPTL